MIIVKTRRILNVLENPPKVRERMNCTFSWTKICISTNQCICLVPTAALCILSEKIGGSKMEITNAPPSSIASANVDEWRTKYVRTATLEFNRDRKSMSVLCQSVDKKDGNRLLVKGAPNLLIKRCTHVKFRDGTVQKLSGDLRRMIEAKTSELATRPLRCLALAVKETKHLDRTLKDHLPEESEGNGDAARKHPLLSDQSKYADIESGLTLVGKIHHSHILT